MASIALSGKTGSATATGGTGGVGTEITSWNCTLESDLLESTSFDSVGWKEFIQGLSGCSGSLTAVATAPVVGPIDALVLQVASSAGAYTLSGAAILSTVGPTVEVDGLVEFSSDFTFTGAVTPGTVSA